MTAIATRMIPTIATKLQVGAAACVLATAAVLTPMPVAHAGPGAPIPLASVGSLGGSAGTGGAALISPDCVPVGSPDCAASLAPSANSTFALPGGGSILQNPLWWFGSPNPTPPTQTNVFTFSPLALVPGFLRPLFSWFSDINFEICVVGLTLRIGPYGTVSGSYGRGCA
jgi:hypothetical protein